MTLNIREECRECICKPLVCSTISKRLVFFKKHTPIKIFKPKLVGTLYHRIVNNGLVDSAISVLKSISEMTKGGKGC